MTEEFEIIWHDRHREPSQPPDPNYPTGIDLDVTAGRKPACVAALPYPSRRCGFYSVRCNLCGCSVACTTAGRPDDPRSIRLACRTDRHKSDERA
jgi:hypothetical protein